MNEPLKDAMAFIELVIEAREEQKDTGAMTFLQTRSPGDLMFMAAALGVVCEHTIRELYDGESREYLGKVALALAAT